MTQDTPIIKYMTFSSLLLFAFIIISLEENINENKKMLICQNITETKIKIKVNFIVIILILGLIR